MVVPRQAGALVAGFLFGPAGLPNGLRLVHLPVDSPVAYCGLAVNAGTRDERPDEMGLAHFVEHMLFKGCFSRGRTSGARGTS